MLLQYFSIKLNAGDGMIITKKKNEELPEVYVQVTYPRETSETERLFSMLHSLDKQLLCMNEYREQRINAADILYIESVDKKTFVYLKECVVRTEGRIYQLKEQLAGAGFVQINKACLLNINQLTSIMPLHNSRLEALLNNGEKLLVSRKYLGEIKQALKED